MTTDLLALELAGSVLCKRWKLSILALLASGCERFGEIAENLPGVSAKVLSSQLRELERDQLVVRIPKRGHRCYALTDAGSRLQLSLENLAIWGAEYHSRVPDAPTRHGLVSFYINEARTDETRGGGMGDASLPRPDR